MLAIHPYAETTNSWPLLLERIEESPDGLQARLCGRSGGAHFAVFDTLYFKTSATMRSAKPTICKSARLAIS